MSLTAAPAPLIITCAITGDHQKTANPRLPVTLEEQVAAAREARDAGAAIVHFHARTAADPNKGAEDSGRYREINDAIRAAVPDVLIDNTQLTKPAGAIPGLVGRPFVYSAANLDAGPDLMSLNPGPMTFRGEPSPALITSFDDTVRTAFAMRERGIKPQVFLYHPGHLDILHELIAQAALTAPVFVQLVFGQQGGISASLESFLYMTRNLPSDCVFQACALGSASIELNVLSMLHGGHVRTGMEDSLTYRPGEAASGNRQLVERVVRIAGDLGRRIATPAETRRLLGIERG